MADVRAGIAQSVSRLRADQLARRRAEIRRHSLSKVSRRAQLCPAPSEHLRQNNHKEGLK